MQSQQGGSIGITLDAPWAEPLSDSPQDLEAAERLRMFVTGWWVDDSGHKQLVDYELEVNNTMLVVSWYIARAFN